MTDAVSIRVENGPDSIKVFTEGDQAVKFLLKRATIDIAHNIELFARQFAPEGKTGELKAHPVDVKEVEGVVESRAPLFGGGFAVRGPGGFIPGRGGEGGSEVAHIIITLPNEPKHAIWVHEGTGIFGPHHSPIVSPRGGYMVFHGRVGKVVTKAVKGQTPQPYLTEAYELVDATYVPKRVAELKAEIAAALG